MKPISFEFPLNCGDLKLENLLGKTFGNGSKVTTESGCLSPVASAIEENIEYLEGWVMTFWSGLTKSNPTLFTFDSDALFRNSCNKKLYKSISTGASLHLKEKTPTKGIWKNLGRRAELTACQHSSWQIYKFRTSQRQQGGKDEHPE